MQFKGKMTFPRKMLDKIFAASNLMVRQKRSVFICVFKMLFTNGVNSVLQEDSQLCVCVRDYI